MSEEQNQPSQDLTFSQRYGYEPLPEPAQLGELSVDLRREIWNVVRNLLLGKVTRSDHGDGDYFDEENIRFIERVIGGHLKKTEDEVSTSVYDYERAVRVFKPLIIGMKFHDVISFIEIIANDKDVKEEFAQQIKILFEKHAAAYRLDTSQKPYRFFPCTSKEQGDAIQNAMKTIHDSEMEGAEKHLRDAMEHINKQQYGDSIADSIHAVESVARRIDPKASKTLGPALDSLKRSGLLKHPALKEGFEKLYGYACDEQGIRHPLVDKDDSDVGLDEAVFMFGTCASFTAYLVSKHRQANQREADGQ